VKVEPVLPAPCDLTITDGDFQKFREYFYRKTGINFDAGKRYFVDKRLQERIRVTGAVHFRDWFTMLRFQASGEELQLLTNLMTVNETYFLREGYQFDCLVDAILPEIVQAKDNSTPIRIWCIPSSSGEEPYSIAMSILERWPGIDTWDVEIVASDIDTQILRQAEQGRYSARSVQYLPTAWLNRYFQKVGDEYQLSHELRESVAFTRVNLSNAEDTRGYRNFDVIFCRNLLIYFDDVSRKAAAETFFDALSPQGFVLLGHSESMSRISSLYKVRKFRDALVYQKPREAP
jgi:chemotaxis protein methyltransferase CheR